MMEKNPFDIPGYCNAVASAANAASPLAAAALEDLLGQAREQAAFAQAFVTGSAGAQAEALETLAREFAAKWLRHFAPPSGAAAGARYQAALQAHGAALAAIAAEASRKFSAELADDSGAPITSVRELQALWIDCGERAFAEAAHGEAFAAGLAELLAAWVELKATA